MLLWAAVASADQAKAPLGWESVLPGDMAGATGPARIGTVRVITAQEIERSGAATAAEALERLSDVHVTVGADAESVARARGLAPADLPVLLDGVPLGSAFDGRSHLDLIPAAAIEKIVVRLGATSVLDGPGGQAGAIEIVTRRPRGTLDTTFRGRGATGGEPDFEVTAGGRAEPVGYVASAAYQRTDGYHLSRSYAAQRNEDGRERNNSDRRLSQLLLKADYAPVPASTFYGAFDYQDGAYGVPPHESATDPAYLRVDAWRRWTLQVGNSTCVGPDVRLGARFFWTGLETVLDSFDDAGYADQYGPNAFSQRRADDSWGLQQSGAADLGRWSLLTYSLWFQRDAHRDRLSRDEPWTRFATDVLSGGVQDEIRPVDGLSIVAGVAGDGQAQRFASGVARRDTKWALRALLGAAYSPARYTDLHVQASRTARFPTQSELFGGDEPAPNLHPQTSLNFDAGVSQGIWDYARVGVVGFYSTAQDVITEDANTAPASLSNKGSARFAGGTLDLDVHPWPWVRWTTGYTFLAAADTTKKADGRLPYRPAHKATTHLAFTVFTGTEADVLFRYVAGQDYVDPRDGSWGALGPYYALDLRVAQRVFRHFLLFASMENVLDYNYSTEFGYPRRGRTIWLGLRFDGDVLSFGGKP